MTDTTVKMRERYNAPGVTDRLRSPLETNALDDREHVRLMNDVLARVKANTDNRETANAMGVER
jgi:hypothetical protein